MMRSLQLVSSLTSRGSSSLIIRAFSGMYLSLSLSSLYNSCPHNQYHTYLSSLPTSSHLTTSLSSPLPLTYATVAHQSYEEETGIKKVIIGGGTGFIGAQLASELTAKGNTKVRGKKRRAEEIVGERRER